MSTQGNDSLEQLIRLKGLQVGNEILGTDGLPTTASKPVYTDSSKKLAVGGFPFTVPFIAGASDTSVPVLSIQGSATGSADELMHLTLVKGSNATSTIAGFARVTVTDDAGVITSGQYYVPFYTLG